MTSGPIPAGSPMVMPRMGKREAELFFKRGSIWRMAYSSNNEELMANGRWLMAQELNDSLLVPYAIRHKLPCLCHMPFAIGYKLFGHEP